MEVSPTTDWRLTQLASYARLIWQCVTGKRSALLTIQSAIRRRLARGWWASHPGEPFECRLPSGGKLLFEPEHWFIEIYYAGFSRFEPDLQRALRRLLKPGGTFIDCGANVGFFSVIANDVMERQGSVIAIEANARLIAELNRNLKANGITRPAIEAAVTSHSGMVDFFVPPRVDVVGGMKPTAFIPGAEHLRMSVEATTLDGLVARLGLEKVDAIKIDIEGAELDALRSARAIVARDRPVLFVEYSTINWKQYGARHEELQALCESWGYRICRYDVAHDAPVPVEPSFWESELANMILMPEGAE